MPEFKKSKFNSFWYSPLILLILLCILLFSCYKIFGLLKRERDTAQKKELVLDEISNLNQREKELSKNIGDLETDQGTEKTIREKYQVVKPGEKMVIIVDDNNTNTGTENIQKHGLWQWLKGLFR